MRISKGIRMGYVTSHALRGKLREGSGVAYRETVRKGRSVRGRVRVSEGIVSGTYVAWGCEKGLGSFLHAFRSDTRPPPNKKHFAIPIKVSVTPRPSAVNKKNIWSGVSLLIVPFMVRGAIYHPSTPLRPFPPSRAGKNGRIITATSLSCGWKVTNPPLPPLRFT